MTGISLVGYSAASIMWTPLFGLLISWLGWRGAIATHACLAVHAVILGATYRPLPLVQNDKTCENTSGGEDDILHIGKTPFNNQGSAQSLAANFNINNKVWCCRFWSYPILSNQYYILYTTGNILVTFGFITMYIQSPSRGIFKGLDKTEASFLPAAIGACSMIGRITSSFIAGHDCVDRMLWFSVVTSVGGVVACVSFLGGDFISSMAFCGIYGFTAGNVTPL